MLFNLGELASWFLLASFGRCIRWFVDCVGLFGGGDLVLMVGLGKCTKLFTK